ncbi:putative glycoside hydrolase [Novipirellula sp. SH528]|uniref:putative glycoside hydrolase n=1 Tax=Novipirellula sp. SH528 TaxID=3454466 RepID=UPI003F9EC169
MKIKRQRYLFLNIQRCFGIVCLLLAGAQVASAVDSSGRNSHFWITLRPNAGAPSGTNEDVVLANGYRRVDLASPDLACKRVASGSKRVLQIAWKGNDLLGDAGAETLQFNVVAEAGDKKFTIQDVTVNGENATTKGLVLERSVSKYIPRKLNGRRPPKNYFEIHGSIVLRNPALNEEDPEHPFSDLKSGYTMRSTPYPPTTPEKLKAFPAFSWDKVPRTMLIRKTTAYTDAEIKAIANHYDLVVLEKANSAGQKGTMAGMLHTGARLKRINPDIKILFYWNSRIFFGHYGIDNSIDQHRDEWIDSKFTIRDGLPTYDRNNPGFLKWWVGCCEKMIAHPQIDGTFVDKSGVPISMLDALYQATPANKLVMNNNAAARQRIGYVDGTYREGWSGGGNPDTVAETIAIGRETGLNKKMQILRMPVKGAANKREMEDRIDRNLAIYLLYAEEYSYFYWQATVDAKKGKIWEWETSYIDQLNRPLGKPLGPYTRDNHVFTRSFEHCDVFMDYQPKSKSRSATRILWKNDIGSPPLAGSGMSSTDDTYKIEGGGAFAGKTDQFFYLSDAHYGDGAVRASVDSFDESSADAKAGVMFRESLAADAKMVAVLRDPSGRMHMVYRPGTGAALVSAGAVDAAQDRYAMLVRKGDTFVGSYSADGTNWTHISQVSIPMSEKIEMGMAVASHNPTALTAATFSGFARIETSSKSNDDDLD